MTQAAPSLAVAGAPRAVSAVRGDAREYCYRTLAEGSKSFAFAGRLLPKAMRTDAAVLYTFCRRVDDAIDLAPRDSQAGALRSLSQRVQGLYRGEPQEEIAWQAFAELIPAVTLPLRYPQELLAGMEMDVSGARYDTLDDLLLYCHRVAGVVGLMMCHVLRIERDEALRHAAHLGIALQLTNICRDVAEDWQLGRLYVPHSVLSRFGAENLRFELGGALPRNAAEPLSRSVEHLLHVADRFYRSADVGLALLPWRASFAIRTARSIYARIGGHLRARGHDVFAGRAVVPTHEKLLLLARSAATSLARLGAHNPTRARYRLPERILHFPEDVLPVGK